MKQAKEFLKQLTKRQPAGHNQYHNIVLENGELVVTLMLNAMQISIILHDDDLEKDVDTLVNEVIEISGVESA